MMLINSNWNSTALVNMQNGGIIQRKEMCLLSCTVVMSLSLSENLNFRVFHNDGRQKAHLSILLLLAWLLSECSLAVHNDILCNIANSKQLLLLDYVSDRHSGC